MQKTTGLGRRRRGQTMVEFAFVVTAFIMLAMMSVDLGRGILYYNMLSNAVREGARSGIVVSNSTTSVCNVVRARMQLSATAGCGNSSNLNVSATRCIPNDVNILSSKEIGTETIVTATYQFSPITPIISLVTGSTINLTAASTMYDEDWGSPPNNNGVACT